MHIIEKLVGKMNENTVNAVTELTKFAKQLPGFTGLPLNDQVTGRAIIGSLAVFLPLPNISC